MSRTSKKYRPSLSTCILLGMMLGILCGLFFGESCARLQVFGNAFINLLQMSILPYIVTSLISGIGSLSYDRAKALAVKGGLLKIGFWIIGFMVILMMPLAFPDFKTASFFSTSIVKVKEKIDFVNLYIPSNPFSSLARAIIPAVVLFCVALGIALIGMKEKAALTHPLAILSDALTRVANFVVYLTPIGVFAISAAAAGTMTVEEFGRLQVFFVTFNVAALFLTFWILPILLTSCTPFSYKDLVGISREAMITAFTTGNLFIILPILIKNCKDLFLKYKIRHADQDAYINILIPVSFNFPNIGKLLALLFILFAGWFYGAPVAVSDYPMFVVSGLASFFGSVNIAIPFMLDTMQLPTDAFQLYLVTGIINGRSATLLAAMSLWIFTLMATCAITGFIAIDFRRLAGRIVLIIVVLWGAILGTRLLLSMSVKNTYTKDQVVARMNLLQDPLPAEVRKSIPLTIPVTGSRVPRLDVIRERGVLRVGYNGKNLPYSYFNQAGRLVGFDIEMAHRLARELGVSLEFIPFELNTLVEQLDAEHFDIVMSGVHITTDRMEDITFSDPYLDVTLSLIVKDHRREEFISGEQIRRMKGLKIGILAGYKYYAAKLMELIPEIELAAFESPTEFFENPGTDVDAFLIEAEAGAAWSLLYPEYQVVVPKPNIISQPLGYPVAGGDSEMVNFINRWIDLKKKDKTIQKIYDYWILGKGATSRAPRWSILRDVLHWVE